jgi:flagella basal body P-ring formation protein FlgA
MARVHVGSVHAEVARDPAMVIGMQLKQQIQPGVPIPLAELMQPTQISRGDPVRLQLQVGGLSVVGQGVALESGAAGERIRVRNVSSQAVLEGEVVQSGIVRVIPGTAPLTTQARSGITPPRGGRS